MELTVKRIQLTTTDSTNRYICNLPVAGNELVVVSASFQTSGHGQKGNSWEGERGKNLLVSFAFRAPFVPAERQFLLSQALSLSLRDTLREYIPDGENIRIKWPNDIYYKNGKICGFLVTCDWENGIIGRCIAGIGLNINQEQFISDAPNPVSLKQIIHKETPVGEIRERLIYYILHYYNHLKNHEFEWVETNYARSLYHREGFHLYKDKNGEFRAEIKGVTPQGVLILRDDKGEERRYAFKEVVQSRV